MAKLEEHSYLQGGKEGDVVRVVYARVSTVLEIVLPHKQSSGYSNILIFSHFDISEFRRILKDVLVIAIEILSNFCVQSI